MNDTPRRVFDYYYRGGAEEDAAKRDAADMFRRAGRTPSGGRAPAPLPGAAKRHFNFVASGRADAAAVTATADKMLKRSSPQPPNSPGLRTVATHMLERHLPRHQRRLIPRTHFVEAIHEARRASPERRRLILQGLDGLIDEVRASMYEPSMVQSLIDACGALVRTERSRRAIATA